MTAAVMHARSQRLLPWVYSVLLHAAFLALMVLSFHWTNSTLPSLGGTGQVTQPVQATVVDQKLINQQMALLRSQEQQKQAAAQKLEQQAQTAKAEREQEQQKLTQLQQQQAAAQQALNTKLAELQRQAQAEKAQQDKIAKLKAEAASAAKKRQSAQRQAELQREIAVEERARNARMASLLQQYTALIYQKVYANWDVPPSVTDSTQCVVLVHEVPGGDVTNVQVLQCNADDAVKQSVITAVYKSSPLPLPPDPSLFLREFQLTFKKQGS